MERRNDEIAALLQEYAELLAVIGEDPFRARAYEKAARAVAGHPADVSAESADQVLQIPNVGKSIAAKIADYLRTGRIPALEDARSRVPPGVRELVAVPGLGPKRAHLLHERLGVRSVPELAAAIDQGRLRDLPGFGERTEDNLRHGIALFRQAGERVRLDVAMQAAEAVVAELSALPGCVHCACAGSVRRMRETAGDLDILVAAEDSAPFMAAFTALPGIAEVIARGDTKTSVRTAQGLQIDLRVLPPGAWGAGLLYFTGSKAHNIKLRSRAARQGLKLSEYGLFEVESGRLVAAASEEDVYRALGLPWIPPTLREDRGEIAAALAGGLPEVVRAEDIRGDLHTHTDLTDGLAGLEAMVEAAAERGYAYYAVTDHAPQLAMQRMTEEKILAQREQLRALDRRHRGLRLLHGTELNIDRHGGVDWPDDFLADFDLCVASVHGWFDLPRDEQTRRLVRACENPHVHVIGHPTTRLLGRRGPIDVDLDEVFAACARTGTVLEVNAHPERLDLPDAEVHRARGRGVRFAVDTDAHSIPDLGNLRYGIGAAQRGWLTPDDVVNTWPLARLRRLLRGGGRH